MFLLCWVIRSIPNAQPGGPGSFLLLLLFSFALFMDRKFLNQGEVFFKILTMNFESGFNNFGNIFFMITSKIYMNRQQKQPVSGS